jgi:predicted RNA binding protein YcfA (HicA-like mRNA interferase family)
MLKSVSHRELIKRFRALGFEGPYSGGKHQFMTLGAFRLRIPNPHKGDISRVLLAEILREAGISKTEWNKDKK